MLVDTGWPFEVKNVSKYRMKELTFVLLCAVETNVKEEEKSNWRGVISLRMRFCQEFIFSDLNYLAYDQPIP